MTNSSEKFIANYISVCMYICNLFILGYNTPFTLRYLFKRKDIFTKKYFNHVHSGFMCNHKKLVIMLKILINEVME